MAVLVAFVDALLQLLFVLLSDGCKDVSKDVKFVQDLCDVVGEQSCERSDAHRRDEMEDLVTVRVTVRAHLPSLLFVVREHCAPSIRSDFRTSLT